MEIDTDDKLPNDIIENGNIMVLITYLIKYNGKYYPQIFSEEALYDEQKMQNCYLLVDSNQKFFSPDANVKVENYSNEKETKPTRN